MNTVEFKEKLQNANTIDALILLRKEVKSTRFMSIIYSKIVGVAQLHGYEIVDCSYSSAEKLIGTAYPMSRKQNFEVSKSKIFKKYNDKTISDAIVIYSDGRGTVTVIIK